MNRTVEKTEMTDKLAKIVRSITLAPILAGVMLLVLFWKKPDILGGLKGLLTGILFLTILPILAYPLQKYIPGYKDRGREGQRSLAMIFAVTGYVAGCLQSLVSHAGSGPWIIYLEYLLSGAILLVLNKCLHVRASGHACGVAGPMALLLYFGVKAVIPGLCIMALTWWASLHMKRHTLSQLLGGTVIPVCVICLLYMGFH